MSGIRLYPAKFDVDLSSGSSKSFEVNIQNDSTQEQVFRVEGRCIDQEHRCDSSWIVIQEDLVTVDSESATSVLVNLKVPEGADLGGYYPSLVFSPESQLEGITIATELAVSFLVDIEGEQPTSPSIDLNNFSSANCVLDRSNIFEVDMTNNSNTHIIPQGYIKITDPVGTVLSSYVTLNDGGTILMPGEEANFDLTWSDMDTNFFVRPGSYKASLTIVDSSNSQVIASQTLNFCIVPYWMLILLFITGLVGFASFQYIRKRIRKN